VTKKLPAILGGAFFALLLAVLPANALPPREHCWSIYAGSCLSQSGCDYYDSSGNLIGSWTATYQC
jgi:hypothetical protein